ncbi:MAG: hypothetical protein EAZ61_01110 [Oscillatoriales cyanobacterium]|nr:MAG: hypothetical protein EAZ61_01110 [Oscillatoriales cyanobacterium]
MHSYFQWTPTGLIAVLAAMTASSLSPAASFATEMDGVATASETTDTVPPVAIAPSPEAAMTDAAATPEPLTDRDRSEVQNDQSAPMIAIDTEEVIDTAESLLEFGDGVSRIRPIKGPIAGSAPEVYSQDELDDLRTGFFFAPGGGVTRERGIFTEMAIKLRDENGRTAAVSVTAGQTVAGLEASYTQAAIVGDDTRLGYRARAGLMNSTEAVFLAPEDAPYSEVFLPRGEGHEPWVNRLGASFELFVPLATETTVLVPGLSYQHVRISDSAFGDDEFARDGCFRTSPIAPACNVLTGNRLSYDDDGDDDLLYLSLFLHHDSVETNETGISISGTRYQVGTQQSIPIGDSGMSFNRLSGGLIHYIPLNLFGFAEGPRVLALNLQAGTILGDELPPYEAFSMGGYHSIRGFGTGDAGTAKSFAQLLAEYRFPILNAENSFFDSLRGSLYAGYGTDFASSNDVPGEPGPVRTKPGGGVALGAGLLFDGVPIVDVVRLDAAVNGLGDFRLYFGLSQRF